MKELRKLIRVFGLVCIVLGAFSCSNQGMNNPTAPQPADVSASWFANLYTARGTGDLDVWCINAECSGEIQVMTPAGGDYVIGYFVDPNGSRNPDLFEDYYLVVRAAESVMHHIGLRPGDIGVAVGIASTQIPDAFSLEKVGWGYFLAPWGMLEDQIPQQIRDATADPEVLVNEDYWDLW